MQQQTTPQQLLEALQALYKPQASGDDYKKHKYIIYARKSTDDREKQVRSLTDQIAECKQLAENLEITKYKIITESESAKEPDIRPKFREALDSIQSGKYDGLIAWHPDRLARNMKDAGEIIDLVDKSIIKDLKFVSFTFENSPSGKMLLGIAFVLSKQYSDKLSEDVSRGIRRSIQEGKYVSTAKHGYHKDSNQFLRPDGRNFTIIKEAFKMRFERKTLEEICAFINKSNYHRTSRMGGEPKIFKMDNKRLSEIFRDPIYAGVVMYGQNITNLTELYDFVPMITPDEYYKLNKESPDKKTFQLVRNARKDETVRANLLRGIIICGLCNSPMSSGINSKTNTRGEKQQRYYYRCDTKDCPTKNVRAKMVIEFVYAFLSEHPFTSKQAYSRYKKAMGRLINTRTEEYKKLLRSLKTERVQKQKRLEDTKTLILEQDDQYTKNIFTGDLKKLQTKIGQIEKEIKKVQEQKENVKGTIHSFEEFIELFGNLAKSIQKIRSMEKLDHILRKIFLNFTVRDKKIASFTLHSPFDELVETNDFSISRGERT